MSKKLFLLLLLFLLGGCTEPLPSAAPPPSAPASAPERSWELLLVNAEHPVPAGYSFEQRALPNGLAVDARAYDALTAMLDACRAAGLSPIVCSAYRSPERQQELFSEKVEELLRDGLTVREAEERAAALISRPGHSEHQTGLAVDIVALSYQLLDERQAETAEQRWLSSHCAEYGFVLRYPEGKFAVTGVSFEPWHYRYVGRTAAAEMTARSLTLEVYLAG